MTPSQQALLASRYKSDGMAASSPQKLVVLIYQRLSIDLDKAIVAINANQVEAAHKVLINAQDLVFELQLALDSELWPGAVELQAIYDFLLGLLVAANLKKSTELVQRCIDIVSPLGESWVEAYQMLQRVEAGATTSMAGLT